MCILIAVGGSFFGGIIFAIVSAFAPDEVHSSTSPDGSSRSEETDVKDAEIPARPAFTTAFPSGVQLASARYSAGAQPGMSTQLRIYLPGGEHQAASIGCVLVAPAGTNLLCGSSIDGEEYHDEALPYAEAGYATLRYSLDGNIDDLESATPAQMTTAYNQFRAAGAGTVNAKLAVAFVLARLPEVDPSRIYTAGHSSAGTVALLAAMHDERIAGCIAYAPCSDVIDFHSEFANEPFVAMVFPGMSEFDREFSPMQHSHQLNCPTFLFQASDDSVVRPQQTKAFADRLRQSNANVSLSVYPMGGHYDSMIDPGISRAINWLQQTETAR